MYYKLDYLRTGKMAMLQTFDTKGLLTYSSRAMKFTTHSPYTITIKHNFDYTDRVSNIFHQKKLRSRFIDKID